MHSSNGPTSLSSPGRGLGFPCVCDPAQQAITHVPLSLAVSPSTCNCGCPFTQSITVYHHWPRVSPRPTAGGWVSHSEISFPWRSSGSAPACRPRRVLTGGQRTHNLLLGLLSVWSEELSKTKQVLVYARLVCLLCWQAEPADLLHWGKLIGSVVSR